MFKGYCCESGCPSLNGSSLEITHRVPLINLNPTLQHDFLSPLGPAQWLLIPSFLQVKGSIRSNLLNIILQSQFLKIVSLKTQLIKHEI